MIRAAAVAAVAFGAVVGVPAYPRRAPSTEAAPQGDSLTAAVRRAARAWRRHDFAAFVAGSPGVMVRLGGAEPSTAMPPAQAALTLEAFAGAAVEVEAEVVSVREVDGVRAFAEIQRTYVEPGTASRRVQTLYLGWRRVRGVPRLVEVRVVP